MSSFVLTTIGVNKVTETSFPLYLPADLKAKLIKLADGRPLSTYIVRILEEHVKKTK